MKKHNQFIGLLLCFLFSTPLVQAQGGKTKANIQYQYGLPLGSFKSDLISEASPRGFSADILYHFSPKFALGGGFGFQDFFQKNPRDLYKLTDGSDISAVVTNTIQIIPLVAKGTYYPLADNQKALQPWVSLGLGASLVSYGQYLGQFGGKSASVHFAGQTGAGLKIAFGKQKQAGLLLGSAFNFNTYNKNDLKNLNTLQFSGGIQIPLK